MTTTPFPEEAVSEVPLPNAPLVRVLAQLRYSPIASLTQMEFIAPFQEALRDSYPTMEEQREVKMAFGPQGVTQSAGDRQWKLTNPDKTWSVVLAPSFTSLETTQYESRTDFVGRLVQIVEALRKVVGEVQIERLGVRYTDRLQGELVADRLADLIRPEALGPASLPLNDIVIRASVTETEFELGAGVNMTARWGLLPAGATLTPDIPPVDEPSWVLDLDAAKTEIRLSEDIVAETAEYLCARLYGFFRWVVTDEFIRVHGGEAQ